VHALLHLALLQLMGLTGLELGAHSVKKTLRGEHEAAR